MKKIYLSSILIILLIFVNTNTVYCTTPWDALYQSTNNFINDANGYTQSIIENYVSDLFKATGFIIDGTGVTLQKIRDALKGVSGSGIDDNSTVDDIGNYISQNISVSDNSITLDESINSFINNYNNAQDLVYCYSYGLYTKSGSNILPKNTSVFRSVAQLESAINLIGGNNGNVISAIDSYDKNYVWWLNNPSNGYQYLYKFSLTEHPYLVFKNATGGATPTGNKTGVMFVDSYGNTLLQPADACYRWNNSSSEWELQESASYTNGTVRNIGLYQNPQRDSNDYSIILNYFSRQYRWFSYSSSLSPQDVISQPYYYNNDVWQDFSSTIGDYVVTDENINTVSYGDIVSYTNSFNTENGYPPTSSDINIYIENEDDENKNPSGGGGSGESGSGDDDSDGTGVLGSLGKLIGNFLRAIIQFITGILEGIVSGLTDLLESLTSLISDFVEGIPNVLTPLIGWIFDGLPSEIKALIVLGIGLGILASIIKIIRG